MQKCIDKYGERWYYNHIKRKQETKSKIKNQKSKIKEIHSIHSIYKCYNEKDENMRKVQVIPLGKNL